LLKLFCKKISEDWFYMSLTDDNDFMHYDKNVYSSGLDQTFINNITLNIKFKDFISRPIIIKSITINAFSSRLKKSTYVDNSSRLLCRYINRDHLCSELCDDTSILFYKCDVCGSIINKKNIIENQNQHVYNSSDDSDSDSVGNIVGNIDNHKQCSCGIIISEEMFIKANFSNECDIY